RHRRERRGDLEGAADAGAGDRARRQAVDAPSEQCHAAPVRRELAVDEIETGCLAGAVGSDHRDDLTRSDGERDIAYRFDAAERLGEAIHREHDRRRSRVVVGAHRLMRASSHCTPPPMPMGNTSTSINIATPRSARQYSVARERKSCNPTNAAAPRSGPASALSPPRSTMTSASSERGIARDSGEMLPLEKAYRPPARPANAPAMAK